MSKLIPTFAIAVWCTSVAFPSGLLAASAATESPIGRWNTINAKTGKVASEVEVYEKEGKIFGKIVKLTEPNDGAGMPKVCSKCPGADKDRPIIGLVIIRDLGLKGNRYKDGTILDPEEGKVFKAEIWVEGGKLKVRGKLGLLSKTRTWIKAE